MYIEDFRRGTNKEIGPKDIFEMGSMKISKDGRIVNMECRDMIGFL